MSPLIDARRRAALCACAFAALTAACTTVGPNFTPPQAPKTSTYAMAGDAAPAQVDLSGPATALGPWWSAFGSPALDATVRQALHDSPTLTEADAVLAQARAALAAARGEAGPKVDANAGLQRERVNLQAFGFTGFGDVVLTNPTFNLYTIGGGVGYDLDLFGGQRRRVESATARAEAQARRAEAAYLTLTGNVALQALTIATLRAQIEATEQMIAADQANIALVDRARALGAASEPRRITALSQLEDDRALLPPLQGQLAAARHALAQLVGHAPADWTAPDFALAEMRLTAPIPVAVPSDLVRRRPDILTAEAELHAATADVGVATADLYPKLQLSAALTQGAMKPENLFSYDASAWSFSGGLTAPIFDGGALRARRQQAREAALAASARYQQTVLTAFVQVADALSALQADNDSIAAHERSESQNAESVRLAKVAYEKGGGTLLELLDAQRDLAEARSALVRARGQRLIDAVRLFTAAGADWRPPPKSA